MKTVSLELSKQLKEAGYPQENHEFYWEVHESKLEQPEYYKKVALVTKNADLKEYDSNTFSFKFFASPLADEILDFLPAQIKNKRLQIDKMPAGEFCISYIPFNASDQEEIVVFGTTPTLADTLAKMWLYLKENNLLEVKG